MTDRAADKPSNATTKGKEAAEELDAMFPDENEHARRSRHSAQRTATPEVETYQAANPYADMEQLGKLLDESQSEEEMLGMPPYGGERYSRSVEPSLPDSPAYDLSADSAMGMNSMEEMVDIDAMRSTSSTEKADAKDEPEFLDIFDTLDEESSHGTDDQAHTERPHEEPASPGKRIQLTEDDYADRFFPGRDEAPSHDVEAEEFSGEVESTPPASPSAENPVAESSPDLLKSRANTAVLLGLLGVAGAAFAIWLGLGVSNRVDHLEAQRVASSPAAVSHAQTAAIASLNHRFDKLSGQFAAHMKQFAQMQEKVASENATVASKPAAPAAAQPKPAAAKPATPAAMQSKPATKAVSKPVAPATTKPATAKKPVVVAVKHASPSPAKPSSSAKPVATAQPSKTGEWVVNLSSFRKPAVAARELARIKKMGLSADSIKVDVHGQTWFRIRALGYASEKAAREHLKAVEKRVGITDAWIGVR